MDPVSGRLSFISNPEIRKKTVEILSCLIISRPDIQKMTEVIEEQIKFANSPDEEIQKKTDLLWGVTYVRKLLQGNENGEYLGVDLGGTNLRISKVFFKNGVAKTEIKHYAVGENLLREPVEQLMDYIADCLGTFLDEDGFPKNRIPLGFTFSFPSVQKSLKSSTLVTWTKRFRCPNGPGLDPCVLLEEAIGRKGGLPIEIVARVNDTTATLLAGTYVDTNCRVGLGLGTGSNASFVEHIENIEKWEGDLNEPKQVVVNSEWGCLGDNGCLDFYRTEFEKEVDQYSDHVGSFTFEKSHAGLYLGEMTRLVLVKLIENGVLFAGGKFGSNHFPRWKFDSKHVTRIEKDKLVPDSTNTQSVLAEFGVDSPTEEEIVLVKFVCSLVSQRAAYIVATVLAVMLKHVDLPEVTVAAHGSLYEHHPNFHDHMMSLINKLLPEVKVNIIPIKEGGGQGAAFAAAVATI